MEKHVAETGAVLTESQVQALEKKQDDDVAHGEIETEHPGYLGSQDTFYVGTTKGVGKIYPHTFVYTYFKWAAAKLYTTQTPITAADLLNEQVLPFFAEQGMGVLRILTDRGTEYCGKRESHDYQLYLALTDIEHSKRRLIIRRSMASANGSIRRFCKSFIKWRSGERSIDLSKRFKPTLTTGWVTTTMSGRTKEKCAVAVRLCKPLWKEAWDRKVADLNNQI